MFAQGEYRLPTLLKNGGEFNPGRRKRRCAKKKAARKDCLSWHFRKR
jgi:hypothetical protein